MMVLLQTLVGINLLEKKFGNKKTYVIVSFFYFNKPKPVTTYLPPCLFAIAGGLLYKTPLMARDEECPPSKLAAL